MKTVWKRRGVAAAVLLLVCGAVYMNWRYSDSVKDNKVLGQSELVNANEETAGDPAPAEDDYFATARLSRKQARDNAIHMLQEAESDENAEESVLNEASRTLQVLASYTVAESQIESLVTAKGYADCVVFMGEDSVSVVVAAPETGLNTADVARIKDSVWLKIKSISPVRRAWVPSRSPRMWWRPSPALWRWRRRAWAACSTPIWRIWWAARR